MKPDEIGRLAKRRCREMGVALRRHRLGVPKQRADDRQGQPLRRSDGREGVAQVMQPNIAQPRRQRNTGDRSSVLAFGNTRRPLQTVAQPRDHCRDQVGWIGAPQADGGGIPNAMPGFAKVDQRRCRIGARKHPRRGPRQRRQHLDRQRVEVNGFRASLAVRQARPSRDEIDIIPAKRLDLGKPGACEQQETDDADDRCRFGTRTLRIVEGRQRWRHVAMIRERYGSRDLESDAAAGFRLTRWLYALCWTGDDRPGLLFDRATTWLLAHKIPLPGITTLERLINRVRHRATLRLWRRLPQALTDEQRRKLHALVSVDGVPSVTLEELRTVPKQRSPTELLRHLEHIDAIRATA